MPKTRVGSRLVFWLPVLCLALAPAIGTVDDAAAPALEAPAAAPSEVAALLPANTPPTLKALGGAVRPGGRLVLAAYATDADSEVVQLLAALHLQPGQRAPSWLGRTSWAAPLGPHPLLQIAVSPPADAAPATYIFELSAADDGGLSALGEMRLEVLPPEAPPGASSDEAKGRSPSSPAAAGGASPKAAGAAAFRRAAPKSAAAAQSSATSSPSLSLSLSVSPASVAEGTSRNILVSATLMGVTMVPDADVTGVLQVSGTATDGADYSLSGTKSIVIPAGRATLTGTSTLLLSALPDEERREDDETVKFRVTQVTRGAEVLALSGTASTTLIIANVYAKPPKVSGVAAEAASDGSLKVTWDASEASPAVTKYIVQHRRDDKPDGDWTRAEVSGEVPEALATGLQPGRRYDVRVRARNKVGKSGWSHEATANTRPSVTLSAADGGAASIGEGNAQVGVALTGSAKAKGGGTLTGQWFRVTGSGAGETETAWGSSFPMASKRDYEKTAFSDAPGTRKYRLRATHELSGDRTSAHRDVAATWLPKVLLSARPSSVPEDGGARTVRVKAQLTGRTVSSASKSVAVKVKGGTATEGTDFAAVSNFALSIPGGERSATSAFVLSPTADSVSEGGETVKIKGSATEGGQELKVRGAELRIEDERVILSISPTPTNGSVTGPGIACGAGTTGDCSETVTKSAPLTLTASPSSGWAFKAWSGACSSDRDASCALTVSGAATVGASFRRPKLKVKVSPASGGSVTGSGIACGSGTSNDCSEKVSTGSLALTASPASGHSVRSWSGGGCSGTGTTCTADVTADAEVTVTFARQTRRTLTVSPVPSNGHVTGGGIDCGAGTGRTACSATLNAGAAVTLSATPDAGHRFGAWTGCASTTNSCAFALTGDKTVSASFVKQYALRVSRSPSTGGAVAGSIVSGTGTVLRSGVIDCGSDCAETVDSGAKVKLTATAAAGHRFEDWTGCDRASGSVCTQTLDSAERVTANFVKQYALRVGKSPSSGGSVAGSIVSGAGTVLRSGVIDCGSDCAETVDSGAKVKLTATAAAGHRFEDWTGCDRASGSVCTQTLGSSETVTANFVRRFALRVGKSPSAGGSVAGSIVSGTGTVLRSGVIDCGSDCMETVDSGAKVKLTATAAAGHRFEDWTGCDRASGSVCTQTLDSVERVTANFVKQYALRVSRSPSSGGSVSGSIVSGTGTVLTSGVIDCGTDCTETVDSGAKVKLTAIAAAGHRFEDWTGCDRASGSVCIQTLDSAERVTANFVQQFALRVGKSPSAGGSVAGSIVSGTGTVLTSGVIDCGSDCAETVDSGAKVKLTATAAAGHRFEDWTGCDSASGSVCTQTVNSAERVTANFVRRFALRVGKSPSAGGSVAGSIVSGTGTVLTSGVIDCGSDCMETVDWGAKVKLTATAAAGHRFEDWTGCDRASGSVCTQTVGSSETVTANFVRRFALTVGKSLSAGGSVAGSIVSGTGTVLTSGVIDCGSDCAETVDSGAKVKLTATAAAGHRFEDWTGCDSASGSVCTQTVDSAETVTANFVRRFALRVGKSPSAGGSVAGSIVSGTGTVLRSGVIDCGSDCAETVDSGAKVKLTATAAAGYRFNGWTGCDSAGGAICVQTVGGNETVTANFSLKSYTLRVAVSPLAGGNATGGGINCGAGISGQQVCSKKFNHGSEVALAASPETGYRFVSWTGCDSKNGSACAQTVEGDEKVTANFSLKSYTLTVTRPLNGGRIVWGERINCGSGSDQTDCTEKVAHGESVSLAAQPATGYKFNGWTGKCHGQATATCTFDMNAPATAGATFTKKKYKLEIKPKPSNGYVEDNNAAAVNIDCGSGTGRTKCVDENVEHGTSVSLTAHPATGYKSNGWTGKCHEQTTATCTFIMNGPATAGATFTKKKYKLEIKPKPSNGYVEDNNADVDIDCGSGTGRTDCVDEDVEHDTSVSLTAHPDTGYEFNVWTGACHGRTATCTFDMNGPATAGATFKKKKYTLTVTRPLNGGRIVWGDRINCGSGSGQTDCTETVAHDESVSLAAQPATGRKFAGWSRCPASDANASKTTPCAFPMTKSETVAANAFPLKKYKLEIKPKPSNGYVEDNNADVDINCGSGTDRTDCVDENVKHGTSVSLTAHPDTGYKFKDWTGKCDVQMTATATCTFSMNAAATVGATFKKKEYTLTVTRPLNGGRIVWGDRINCGSGSDQTDCTEKVAHDESVSLAAQPATGRQFAGWSRCPASGANASKTTPCAFTMTRSETVAANAFPLKKYKLEIKPKPSKGHVTWGTGQSKLINCGLGTGRTDCTETEVQHGTSISLVATPKAGYRLKNWTCSPGSSPCPPATLTGNLTVAPNFETTLTVDAGGPYQARYHPGFGRSGTSWVVVPPFYQVTVTAVAQGGRLTVPGSSRRIPRRGHYEYQWKNGAATTNWSTSGSQRYLFFAEQVSGSATVTARARDLNRETASDDATINFGSAGGAGGASGASGQASHSFPVPLGGELLVIWGGADALSAVSEDSTVARVAVAGTVISVAGVSAGSAKIVVRVGSEEFHVPVRVGGG